MLSFGSAGFSSAFNTVLVKDPAKRNSYWRRVYNKCDLTVVPCFRLANHNDSSRWFDISSSSVVRGDK
jgi:hypothetical protein